jgi:SAM-dependent methyltransferase
MRGQRLRCLILVGFLALCAVCGDGAAPPLLAQEPSPRGAPEVPYVPTPQEVVVAMLRAAKVGPEDVLYDLGCGDGRIVVTAAQQFGARATGVDLDPQRLSEAQANARRAGVTGRVRFLQQDLFETELRDATVVTLYLLPKVNLRLRPRLLRDLQPGARVVSHAFDMGEWPPDQVLQVSRRTIYLWVVPAQVGGTWVWHQAGTTEAQPYRLRLRQHFQRLSGTLQAGGVETPVTDSELQGSVLRFTVRPEVQGQPVRMVFQGHVEGNLLAGHVHIEDAATEEMQPWRARRESTEGLLLYTAVAR